MDIPSDPDSSILGLSHLLLQVSDLSVAEHFYCELLGLTVKSHSTFGGTRPLTVTHQGVGMTLLPQPGESPLSPEQHNVEHIALWVKGMDSLVARLKAEGIPVDGPKRNEYGLSMSVRDPDNNRVECIEQLDPDHSIS